MSRYLNHPDIHNVDSLEEIYLRVGTERASLVQNFGHLLDAGNSTIALPVSANQGLCNLLSAHFSNVFNDLRVCYSVVFAVQPLSK